MLAIGFYYLAVEYQFSCFHLNQYWYESGIKVESYFALNFNLEM